MNRIKLIIWLVTVLMTVIPVLTAWLDGSLTSGDRQKLKFPLIEHFEAFYGDIFFINSANFFILLSLPVLPVYYHAGIYAVCLLVSINIHCQWASAPDKKPISHFFIKREAGKSILSSFSSAGLLHLFFFPAALTLIFEYTFLARNLPVLTVLLIGSLYLCYNLIAVMGYQTALIKGLSFGYKPAELIARFVIVIIITVMKLPL